MTRKQNQLFEVSSTIRVTSTGNSLILKITKEAAMLEVEKGDIVNVTIRKLEQTNTELRDKVLKSLSEPGVKKSLGSVASDTYGVRYANRDMQMEVGAILQDLENEGVVEYDNSYLLYSLR